MAPNNQKNNQSQSKSNAKEEINITEKLLDNEQKEVNLYAESNANEESPQNITLPGISKKGDKKELSSNSQNQNLTKIIPSIIKKKSQIKKKKIVLKSSNVKKVHKNLSKFAKSKNFIIKITSSCSKIIIKKAKKGAGFLEISKNAGKSHNYKYYFIINNIWEFAANNIFYNYSNIPSNTVQIFPIKASVMEMTLSGYPLSSNAYDDDQLNDKNVIIAIQNICCNHPRRIPSNFINHWANNSLSTNYTDH